MQHTCESSHFSFPEIREIYVYIFYSVATHWCAALNVSTDPACHGWPFLYFAMSELISVPPQHVHNNSATVHTHSSFSDTAFGCEGWWWFLLPPHRPNIVLESFCSLRAADSCVNWTFGSRHVKLSWRALSQTTPKPCEVTGDCGWPSSNLKSGTHAQPIGFSIADASRGWGHGRQHHYIQLPTKNHDNRIGA